MKTTTTLLLALILSVTQSFANGNESKKSQQIQLFEIENHQFRLIYPFADQEKITIKITNEQGKLLTKDQVKNDRGFLRKYDMSELKTGKYQMQIIGESGSYEKSFIIKDRQYLAANHLGNKRVKLICADAVGKSTLMIYNKKMEVIHKESYENMDGFSRVFDLSAFDCDEFTFQLGKHSVALAVNN